MLFLPEMFLPCNFSYFYFANDTSHNTSPCCPLQHHSSPFPLCSCPPQSLWLLPPFLSPLMMLPYVMSLFVLICCKVSPKMSPISISFCDFFPTVLHYYLLLHCHFFAKIFATIYRLFIWELNLTMVILLITILDLY